MPSSKVIVFSQKCVNRLEAVHIETGKFYAAKVISKRLMAGREHMVRNEIAVLRKISLGHESILTLVDYFETVNSCITLFIQR
jgi:hypothetical protein